MLVALQKARGVKDRLLESVVIGQQGLVLAQEADGFERGLQQQLTALEVARGMEATFHEFMRLYTIAMTMLNAADLPAAREYFDQMLALAQDVRHKPYEMYSLGMLGQWQEINGDAERALSHYDSAIQCARESGNPSYEARYLYAIGMVFQSRWDFAAARRHYQQSREIYAALADKRSATRAAASIVYTYLLAITTRLMRLVGVKPPGVS